MRTLDYLEIKKDSTFTFTYFREENNKAIIPVTATISIIDTEENAIITDQAMTINGSTGVCTYAWDSTGYSVGKNYRVIYKIDSYDPVVRLFDIYNYPFVNDITDDDLTNENEAIKEGTWEMTGKAESGTTAALTDSDIIGNADTWNGGLIEIYQDTVQQRKITSFDNTLGKFTFAPALQTAVTTENYIVRKSYQEKIILAGIKVQKDFRALDKRAYLVIDQKTLKWLIIYKFFEEYFGNLVKANDDEYDIQYKKYAKKYKNEFQSMSVVYDEDEDAEIDTDEEDIRVGEVRWNR